MSLNSRGTKRQFELLGKCRKDWLGHLSDTIGTKPESLNSFTIDADRYFLTSKVLKINCFILYCRFFLVIDEARYVKKNSLFA